MNSMAIQLGRVYPVAQQVNKRLLANRVCSKSDNGAHRKFGVVGNIKVKLVVLHVQCGGPKLSLIASDGGGFGHAGSFQRLSPLFHQSHTELKPDEAGTNNFDDEELTCAFTSLPIMPAWNWPSILLSSCLRPATKLLSTVLKNLMPMTTTRVTAFNLHWPCTQSWWAVNIKLVMCRSVR